MSQYSKIRDMFEGKSRSSVQSETRHEDKAGRSDRGSVRGVKPTPSPAAASASATKSPNYPKTSAYSNKNNYCSIARNLTKEFSKDSSEESDIVSLSKKLQLSENLLNKSGIFDDNGNLKRRNNTDGLTKIEFKQKFKSLLDQSSNSKTLSNEYTKEFVSSMYENLSGTDAFTTSNLKQVDYKVTNSSNRQSDHQFEIQQLKEDLKKNKVSDEVFHDFVTVLNNKERNLESRGIVKNQEMGLVNKDIVANKIKINATYNNMLKYEAEKASELALQCKTDEAKNIFEKKAEQLSSLQNMVAKLIRKGKRGEKVIADLEIEKQKYETKYKVKIDFVGNTLHPVPESLKKDATVTTEEKASFTPAAVESNKVSVRELATRVESGLRKDGVTPDLRTKAGKNLAQSMSQPDSSTSKKSVCSPQSPPKAVTAPGTGPSHSGNQPKLQKHQKHSVKELATRVESGLRKDGATPDLRTKVGKKLANSTSQPNSYTNQKSMSTPPPPPPPKPAVPVSEQSIRRGQKQSVKELATRVESGLRKDGATPDLRTKVGKKLAKSTSQPNSYTIRTPRENTKLEANEARRRAEQVRREAAARKTEDVARRKAEQERKEAEARKAEDEARRRAEAARRADNEARRRAEQARREEATRRADDEARRRAEQARREEASRRADDEVRRRAEQARREEAALMHNILNPYNSFRHHHTGMGWSSSQASSFYHSVESSTPMGFYSSSGSANGRQLFEGPRGGTYYLSSGGHKQYV